MSIIKANRWLNIDSTVPNRILQVVTATSTTPQYVSSTTWTPIGPSCSITLAHPNNKVMVRYLLNTSVAEHNSIRLVRKDSVPLNIGDASSTRTCSSHQLWASTNNAGGHTFHYAMAPLSNSYVDTPGAASTYTYSFEMAQPHSTSYYGSVNYHHYSDSDAGWAGRTASVITLMEIQA